eukprot:4934990-Prorocentrum_lima.AAC.1
MVRTKFHIDATHNCPKRSISFAGCGPRRAGLPDRRLYKTFTRHRTVRDLALHLKSGLEPNGRLNQ